MRAPGAIAGVWVRASGEWRMSGLHVDAGGRTPAETLEVALWV
ncbi:hypothetical protein ABZ622_29655 [Streptomyces sp. NPDC007164]